MKRSRENLKAALIAASNVRQARLKGIIWDIANTGDSRESLQRLRSKHKDILGRYPLNQLANYRDELRLIWHPVPVEGLPGSIPEDEFKNYDEWLKYRPKAEPGEMICNRWLARSELALLAV